MTAAPAAWHSLAVVTSSSRVTGSAGTADFCDSAPVGATVISVPGPVALAAAGPGAAPAGVWLVMTRRMPPSGTAVQGSTAHRRRGHQPTGLTGPPGSPADRPHRATGSPADRPHRAAGLTGSPVTPMRAGQPDRSRAP